MKTLIRWLRALSAAVAREGMWVYAPPLVMPACSPYWRIAARPPGPVAVPSPEPARVPAPRTDPRIVAARRASLRLVPGFKEIEA